MVSGPTPRDWSAAVKSAAVAAAWLVLGLIWLGMIVAVGELIHEALAGVWLVSGLLLAVAVGWWMVRAWQTPRRVATLACWWFPVSLAGPVGLGLALPPFRRSRERSLAWMERTIRGEAHRERPTSSEPFPTWTATRRSVVLGVVWLVLAILWMSWIYALCELIHETLAALWAVSDIALAIAAGWWMVRARGAPRKVASIACWWFLVSPAGPSALVLVLPRFHGSRTRSLAWIERTITGALPRRWALLTEALEDPRRPWRVALLLVGSIAAFPLLWFVTIVLLALGSAGDVTDEESVSMQRFAVGVAAAISATAVTGTIFDWIGARRPYPPGERGTFRSAGGVVCVVAVLVALAAAIVFGVWAWSIFVF